MTDIKVENLSYRGYPLQRQGNIIYYGDINAKYVIMIQLDKTEKIKDLDVAKSVLVKLMNNDPTIESRKRVEKKAEKEGLYSAIDLAATWLDRYLK
ncbi:MAG: hypothetical protein LBC38_03325 [Oscillospiraceae bacterium]|jgi:hypothetical protein|nr:hypothetical protein [Oscillospiraceae bacterium]